MARIIRLVIFASCVVVFGVGGFYFGMTWKFVGEFTHPKCGDPVLLQEVRTPEEYWLPTKDGIKIRVWYYPSQNGAAILVFGDERGALGDRLPPIETLLFYGYGIVQVDSRACAQPSKPVTWGGTEVLDAETALDFILSRDEVDPNRIGVFGYDLGCGTAIRVTARHPEIQGVVCDGGFSNLDDLLAFPEGAPLPRRFLHATVKEIFRLRTSIDPQTINPIADLPAIKPRPVYLIYGEFEAGAGLEQFEAAYEPKELWLVPLGSHGRNHMVSPGRYAAYLWGFFDIALLK